MRILILGASGYAGSRIKKELEGKYDNVFGTYRTFRREYEKDCSMVPYTLGDKERLAEILREKQPDVIISSIRGEFEEQFACHRQLLEYLRPEKHARLLFLSTSNVFDGALEKPHFECDTPAAESEYGKFKIQCEKDIRDSLGERGIVLRIPEIYGKDCPRIRILRERIQNRTPIKTYRNLYVNYTTHRQIAAWIAYILENDLTGIFHIGTGDMSDYMEFQKRLATHLAMGEPVFEVTEMPVREYQAVLPDRTEIPDSLQRDIDGVIREMEVTFSA